MFARTKTYKNQDGSSRQYLEIVENQRVDGKVRQRVVLRLGRLDKIREDGQLDRLLGSLAKFSTHQMLIESIADCLSPEWTRELGPAAVFRRNERYQYILGMRMRRVKAARTALAEQGQYQVVSDSLQVREVARKGKRYIVCYNPQEAERDREVREEDRRPVRGDAQGRRAQGLGRASWLPQVSAGRRRRWNDRRAEGGRGGGL